MKNFRRLIPMAVFALAIAGAFTTQAMNRSNKKVSIFQGYVKVNPLGTMCNTSITCSSDPDELCKVGTTQIWGKDASGKCIVELYRVH
ncbi:MAG: DUF6520 family protein [Flavobacterium sp.]|uniref:DUF6520 family protein n=1 Tax=Flavobacterium sp. TaxID=239 RepID=UPI0032677BB7